MSYSPDPQYCREYTRKETKIINDAWSHLLATTDEYRYDTKFRLLAAYKIDRRERGSDDCQYSRNTLSKAVLIECVIDGMDAYQCERDLGWLELRAHGCILATLVGYRLRMEREETADKLRPILMTAVGVNMKHSQRLLAQCK